MRYNNAGLSEQIKCLAEGRETACSLAEKALAKGIKEVVFDRGGYLYTGRVAALADAAREAGLQF